MKIIHYLGILAIAAIVGSCSKGDTGATGPQGPAGNNGVANINTTIYTVTSSDWSATGSPAYTWISSWTASIADNNTDAVLAYWSTASSGWLALPVDNLIASQDEMTFGYDNNIVTFSYHTGGVATLPPSSYVGYTTIYFKVTVIPPALQAKYPGTNWKNASEAMKIPEVRAALNNGNNK